MKLHFYTSESAPFSFELFTDVFKEEGNLICQIDVLENKLNSEELLYYLWDLDWSSLKTAISSLFDKRTNGEFDWSEKTDEYYAHFDKMIAYMRCDLQDDSEIIIASYQCQLAENWKFSNPILSFPLSGFYCGNGEPEGTQLALDMIDIFLRENQWHIGFYDSHGTFVSDIKSWAGKNTYDRQRIIPLVWFGYDDCVQDIWSITLDTKDSFIKEFWGDYYGGALPYICGADPYLFYYSLCEYGLDYDETIFEDVKSRCPIDLDLDSQSRAEALFNLIEMSIKKEA